MAGELADGFMCPPGKAFMAMKAWASSPEESADVIRVIGQHIGFAITGNTQIEETDSKQPPRDAPYGYDVDFTLFRADEDEPQRPNPGVVLELPAPGIHSASLPIAEFLGVRSWEHHHNTTTAIPLP